MSNPTQFRFFFSEDEFWNLSEEFYITMWTRSYGLGLSNVQDHRDYVQMYMGR